jgi:hypothetical protein
MVLRDIHMREEHNDIKQRLEEAIWPDKLDPRVWRDLLTTPPHYVRRVAADKWSFEDLLRLYQQKAEIYAPPEPRKRASSTGPSDARLEALAQIVTIEESAPQGKVAGFRGRFLRDQLLAPEEIPLWVRDRAAAEGRPAESALAFPLHTEHVDSAAGAFFSSLMIPARDESMEWLHKYVAWLKAHPQAESASFAKLDEERLAYFAPGGPVREIPVRRDRVLGELKRLAAWLSLLYKWPEHHAVAYILSDWRPPYPRWQVLYKDAAMPALQRVVLELDPRMSSGEVVALYRRVRTTLGRERDRQMTQKHLDLAVFIAERQMSEQSWSELRAEWNGLHPKERYPVKKDASARRFALDCRNAYMRLTGLRWRGKGKEGRRKYIEKVTEEIIAKHEAQRRQGEENLA